jgi:hypothetical protein
MGRSVIRRRDGRDTKPGSMGSVVAQHFPDENLKAGRATADTKGRRTVVNCS